MEYYYAIEYTNFSMNDSDEKVKEWGTATVFRFESESVRDNYVADSGYRFNCSEKRANYIGYTDYVAWAAKERNAIVKKVNVYEDNVGLA